MRYSTLPSFPSGFGTLTVPSVGELFPFGPLLCISVRPVLHSPCQLCFPPFSIWSTLSIIFSGQGFKDIIKWPRPAHPAKRLQKKWAEEYGMPSTHAMVAIAIPFSVLFYTYNRYIYSIPLGILISVLWCSVICVSRIYFGMHTVLVSFFHSCSFWLYWICLKGFSRKICCLMNCFGLLNFLQLLQ